MMDTQEATLTILGRYCVLIENYRCILQYEEQFIKILTKNYVLLLEGCRFHIEYYDCFEMKITGIIQAVRFEVN